MTGNGPSSIAAARTIRFGPFDLDVRAAELRKGASRIRLPDQPFQVLLMLLERPGEVILREEIRRRLWPASTTVEFDHSINTAVRRLRDALCESASRPRYVETIPRRGYRFIGQVTPIADPAVLAATPAIAVLPFANLSDEKENEYFSDGLAEEIINHLTRASGLKVIARTSAFAFKGKQEDVRHIARTLGVSHVLEGSVRRSGSRVRVIAQLIAATDGGHLWSERYDRELADIFAIQDEIAQAISSALQVRFSAGARQHTPPLPAYEAYLKARYCVASFTRQSLLRGKDFFERAIALDPEFVEARSGLAAAILSSVLPGLSPAREAMPLARAAAQSALNIDPGASEAHAMLGMIASLYDLDGEEAERQFELALKREPIPSDVRFYRSMQLLLRGQPRESAEQGLRGLKDDPLSFLGRFHRSAALLAAGNVVAGESELQELCALHPHLYQPFYLLGISQSLRGLHSEARATAETAYSLAAWNTGTTGLFAGALRQTGESGRAQELLGTLLPADRYGTPLGLMIYCLMCSENDQAANWAWKVLEQRDPRLVFPISLLRSPSHASLRLNENWSAVAARLGIPKLPD